MSLLDLVPRNRPVDWDAIVAHHEDLAALHRCPQDPQWHAEGDVGVHTRMVVEELVSDPRWRQLSDGDRATVFLACLLHDIAKPACTREEDGRITSRGHSRRGSHWVRERLYREGVEPQQREQIAALVMHHQVPFFLPDRDDAERLAITVSQTVRCDLLELVAWADAMGRRCDDRERLVDSCWLFGEACREIGCYEAPFAFPSAHSRFVYFRDDQRSPHVEAYDDTKVEVTVMSGLPGAGKDRWVSAEASDIPVVSLDAIRGALGVDPAGKQGQVIQAARELAREHLRASRPFVWNATNVSRPLRKQVVDLCADYDARVKIVYLEVPHRVLIEQNREREGRVPRAVIAKLLGKWSVPDETEAHAVVWAADVR